MIQIADALLDSSMVELEASFSGLKRSILEHMAASPIPYRYPSLSVVRFEMKLRSHIVEAAKKLNESGADFATFEESRCNPRYWILTEKGGFRLRENAEPAEAMEDIFKNGRSYGFECATAIVIVYYKAIIDSIGRQKFNRLFSSILLYDGVYDEDLGLKWYKTEEYLPGDVLYFKNPDHNPETPEWQGENVVLLEDNRYFAHGIGIKTGEQIIAALNKKRKPGATVSAYLQEGAARPDFAYLAQYDDQERAVSIRNHRASGNRFIIARIGSATYIKA